MNGDEHEDDPLPFSNGAGRYDEVCAAARVATGAKGIILIIIEGEKGAGFSVQAPLHLMPVMADMLDAAAAQIRQELTRLAPGSKTLS